MSYLIFRYPLYCQCLNYKQTRRHCKFEQTRTSTVYPLSCIIQSECQLSDSDMLIMDPSVTTSSVRIESRGGTHSRTPKIRLKFSWSKLAVEYAPQNVAFRISAIFHDHFFLIHTTRQMVPVSNLYQGKNRLPVPPAPCIAWRLELEKPWSSCIPHFFNSGLEPSEIISAGIPYSHSLQGVEFLLVLIDHQSTWSISFSWRWHKWLFDL